MKARAIPAEYTLHTASGGIDAKAYDLPELRAELERRLASGEFDSDAKKRRWMPVSTHGNHLVGRVDLRAKPALVGFDKDEPETPPYVIHTTSGDVETSAWSVHEFHIELGKKLDSGEIPKFDAAPNMGRSRTVTQGRRRVGFVDWKAGEFTPTPKKEDVAYWVGHGDTEFRYEYPMEAGDLAALREELTTLTRCHAFLYSGRTGYWLDVEGPHGVVERRIASSGEYHEEKVAVPYTVHRARSTATGKSHHQRSPELAAKEVAELPIELGGLLHAGEFQTEEDCRMRWLPVAQGDCLVGYLDAAERVFVPKPERRVRFRVGGSWGQDGVPMVADSVEELRSELQARRDDLRHLVEWSSDGLVGLAGVNCGGKWIGHVADDGTLLLTGTDEGGADGASCESCRYWRFRDEDPIRNRAYGRIDIVRKGECRRWSPHPRHGWPVTNGHRWCGEHRDKPSGPESQ